LAAVDLSNSVGTRKPPNIIIIIIMILLAVDVGTVDSQYSVPEVLSQKTGCKQVVFNSPHWDHISDAAKVLYNLYLNSNLF